MGNYLVTLDLDTQWLENVEGYIRHADKHETARVISIVRNPSRKDKPVSVETMMSYIQAVLYLLAEHPLAEGDGSGWYQCEQCNRIHMVSRDDDDCLWVNTFIQEEAAGDDGPCGNCGTIRSVDAS